MLYETVDFRKSSIFIFFMYESIMLVYSTVSDAAILSISLLNVLKTLVYASAICKLDSLILV